VAEKIEEKKTSTEASFSKSG